MIRQPNRRNGNKKPKNKKPTVKQKTPSAARVQKQQYGVSKLETFFAERFLRPLKLDFVYEYEVKDIGRFYDFAIVAVDRNAKIVNEEKNNIVSISQNKNTVRPLFFVEVDGDYW